MSDVLNKMKSRRSIRKFKPDMVPQEILDQIIEAGLYAASGMGQQSPIIIQVTKKELRDEISKMNCEIGGWKEGFDPFYGAPAMLIVLAKKERPTYVYDGSLVMGNLMLAAHELGIGSCWIHRAKEEFESDWGRNLLRSLGVNGDYEGIGHCALGYADGDYLLLQREMKAAYSMLNNPLKTLTKKEWLLWLVSLTVVILSNLATNDLDLLTLISALLGVTALIFAAKGNVWAQFLMIIFCILYGIISFRFHYWGEMITYLGMTLPMAAWSAITWLRNPSEENENEVAIRTLNKKHIIGLTISTVIVTGIFYYILAWLDTPNIMFSTLSIVTSFIAASLTMLRSSYYAVGYAANDIVLIVLWVLASLENPAYIPVVVNFAFSF